MVGVLGTILTIQIPDQFTRKQDGVHLSGIQMVGLSSIQMAFEYQTIWHLTSFFDHLNTKLVRYSNGQYSDDEI